MEKNLPDIQALYSAAYAAFDRGEFSEARHLASDCVEHASKESYWYWGALGLRCWICSFTDDGGGLQAVARELLEHCPDAYRMWFSGLAHLCLGLWSLRHADPGQERASLSAASAAYDAYVPSPTQPPGWALVVRYFAAVSRWAAGGGLGELQAFNRELEAHAEPAGIPDGLRKAAHLLLRYAQGEVVGPSVEQALEEGVSRAFLAPIILRISVAPMPR